VNAGSHVLVLDDDPDIRGLLREYLGANDLRVSAAATGREALELLQKESIDLVVLDLRLPGEDGFEIARRIRGSSKVPVLILSGRADEADRVMGLELAADDYVVKPFSPRELLARIRAVLRRFEASAPQVVGHEEARAMRFAGWELNLRVRRLTAPDGRRVDLSNSEFNLLSVFLSAPQRILSRSQLLERSRLHSIEVYDRSIDVTILRLRRKLEADPANPALLRTQRGAGYLFDATVSVLR
jgi:DNA-binding response OmpR family regulator